MIRKREKRDTLPATTPRQKKQLMSEMAPPDPKTTPAPAGVGRAVALYNWNGEKPTDLSFKKGDVITILSKNSKFAQNNNKMLLLTHSLHYFT